MTACEFCGASSAHARPGIACYRCLFAGCGDPASGFEPKKPCYAVGAQERLIGIVAPFDDDRLERVEQVLAIFGFNLAAIE